MSLLQVEIAELSGLKVKIKQLLSVLGTVLQNVARIELLLFNFNIYFIFCSGYSSPGQESD